MGGRIGIVLSDLPVLLLLRPVSALTPAAFGIIVKPVHVTSRTVCRCAAVLEGFENSHNNAAQ